MFTGIITTTGALRTSSKVPEGRRLTIEAGWEDNRFELGESIAIDGACMTVVDFEGDKFQVEVSAESLDKTTLGRLKRGAKVNLERALRVGDRLGGHFVTGHIDGTGSIVSFEDVGDCIRYIFAVPRDLLKYVVYKGSLAIDGISLTVNAVYDATATVEVMIVPHTQQETTLGTKKVGSAVNLEVDMLGKYVERLLTGRALDAVSEDPMLPPDAGGII